MITTVERVYQTVQMMTVEEVQQLHGLMGVIPYDVVRIMAEVDAARDSRDMKRQMLKMPAAAKYLGMGYSQFRERFKRGDCVDEGKGDGAHPLFSVEQLDRIRDAKMSELERVINRRHIRATTSVPAGARDYRRK